MSDVRGFESRYGLCIFSRSEDPQKAIRENHKNTMHTVWNRAFFYRDGSVSKTQIAMSVVSYGMGMIGYAAEVLIIKILLALGNTFALLFSLFRGDNILRKERTVLCLDTWAALGIGIIGCVIPPLAYRLDKIAKNAMLNKLHLSTSKVVENDVFTGNAVVVQ